MSGSTLVDTNVLVYAVDAADPAKQRRALDVLAERADSLMLSTQVLSEFYVVVTRKLATPLDPETAAAQVAGLSRLPVVATDVGLVRDAIEISRRSQIGYWDALVIAAARAGACEAVLTEDLQDGAVIAGVAIENPFAGVA